MHLYLLRQVLALLLMTVWVFTMVVLLFNVLKEILPLLVGGHVHLGLVLKAIGLLIPFACVYALPMGLITAALLVFGRFSADQELTAARASGVSLLSLVMPVILLSLVCCGLSAWFNLELGPRSRVAYVNLRHELGAAVLDMQLPEGRPINDAHGNTIWLEKNHGGHLEGVTAFMENSNSTTTFHAPRGELELNQTNQKIFLHLFNVHSVTVGARTLFGSSPETVLEFDLNFATNGIYHPGTSDMTFRQLRGALRNLDRFDVPLPETGTSAEMREELRAAQKLHDEKSEQILVAMNRQMAFSFACFGFTLVGIPLGIRMHRRETNVGVTIALGLVVVYYAFIMLGQSLSSRPEFAPHLILWLPNFIFQAVGAVLLWRANRGI